MCVIRLISPYAQMDDYHFSANPSQTLSDLYYQWRGHKVYCLRQCLAFEEYVNRNDIFVSMLYIH